MKFSIRVIKEVLDHEADEKIVHDRFFEARDCIDNGVDDSGWVWGILEIPHAEIIFLGSNACGTPLELRDGLNW